MRGSCANPKQFPGWVLREHKYLAEQDKQSRGGEDLEGKNQTTGGRNVFFWEPASLPRESVSAPLAGGTLEITYISGADTNTHGLEKIAWLVQRCRGCQLLSLRGVFKKKKKSLLIDYLPQSDTHLTHASDAWHDGVVKEIKLLPHFAEEEVNLIVVSHLVALGQALLYVSGANKGWV